MRLSVRVIPRSSQNRIEWEQDTLKVRLTAPPVEGAANEALVALLAGRLGVHKRQVSIARGTNSRQKIVEIEGMTAEEVRQRLG